MCIPSPTKHNNTVGTNLLSQKFIPQSSLCKRLYDLDSKTIFVNKLYIENDNPVWVMLMRYGILIRKNNPLSKNCARVQSLSRSGRLELRLSAGYHCLEWDGHLFDIEIQSDKEGSREVAIINFTDEQNFHAFETFMKYARHQGRRKSEEYADKVVAKVLRTGVWRDASSYPKRKIESVIHGNNVPQQLVDDMRKFVQQEIEYNDFGFPFKRNYLIVGPPGSGKSSLIIAAASELDFDVCYLTITQNMTEQDLCAGIHALTDRSMLVIEDVDVICATATSGSRSAQAALAVLTNVLDGTLHRHGLITVLTSASPESLEDVLVRHGRIDYTARLSTLNKKQVGEMVKFAMSGTDDELQNLTNRLWHHLKTLGASSTVLAHFLFKRRHKHPNDITSEECVLICQGTHKGHINDGLGATTHMYF